MHTITKGITFTLQNEHDLEHDLIQKPFYSVPKIYSAKGDLSKRWFVYFSYRNPETGKMQRMNNVYGKTNKYHTKEERFTLLTMYRKRLIYFLKKGYNPFVDNNELYKKLNSDKRTKIFPESTSSKKETTKATKVLQQKFNSSNVTENQTISEQHLVFTNRNIDKAKETLNTTATENNIVATENKVVAKVKNEKEVEGMIFEEAFNFALILKGNEVNETTLKDYRGKSKKFVKWLGENKADKKYIHQLKRKDVLDFLNDILLKTSARTRNNYRVDLSSLFQVLKNNELVAENYLKSIAVLRSNPEKHKRYTTEKQQEIFKHLESVDPVLLLFIKFISYNFLRPIEVCRIRVKDINVKNQTIQFKSKTKNSKTKIIPEILFRALPNLTDLDPELLLFTPDKIGGVWIANEVNRRDHFSKRFRKTVKKHFNLGSDYGLYSFRHTFITKLFHKLKEEMTPNEAKNNLMMITGHTTMVALEKYLRDIDADLPEDYSALFKN